MNSLAIANLILPLLMQQSAYPDQLNKSCIEPLDRNDTIHVLRCEDTWAFDTYYELEHGIGKFDLPTLSCNTPKQKTKECQARKIAQQSKFAALTQKEFRFDAKHKSYVTACQYDKVDDKSTADWLNTSKQEFRASNKHCGLAAFEMAARGANNALHRSEDALDDRMRLQQYIHHFGDGESYYKLYGRVNEIRIQLIKIAVYFDRFDQVLEASPRSVAREVEFLLAHAEYLPWTNPIHGQGADELLLDALTIDLINAVQFRRFYPKAGVQESISSLLKGGRFETLLTLRSIYRELGTDLDFPADASTQFFKGVERAARIAKSGHPEANSSCDYYRAGLAVLEAIAAADDIKPDEWPLQYRVFAATTYFRTGEDDKTTAIFDQFFEQSGSLSYNASHNAGYSAIYDVGYKPTEQQKAVHKAKFYKMALETLDSVPEEHQSRIRQQVELHWTIHWEKVKAGFASISPQRCTE